MWTSIENRPPDWAHAPWSAPVLNLLLSPAEAHLLVDLAVGAFGDEPGMVFSEPGRRRPTQAMLRRLHRLGCVQFTDAAAGRWDPGMWGARLTVLGANAAYRHEARDLDGQRLDRHVGCDGFWLPDGTCTVANHLRPLDSPAHQRMMAALPKNELAEERRAPRLWCVEHGRLRTRHITTQKVCHLPGTHLHDGGLFRI